MNTVSSNAPLVINQLSKNIYNELSVQGQLQSNQLYIVEEDNLDAASGTIINVAVPAADTDAANKKYVDDVSSNVVNNIKTDITNTLTSYATTTHLTDTLTGYVTTTHLTNTLTSYATTTHLTDTLTDYAKNSTLTDLTNTLTGYVKTASIDNALKTDSGNPVQNKVVTEAINNLSNYITTELGNISTLLDTI